jgi:hypothetical protein
MLNDLLKQVFVMMITEILSAFQVISSVQAVTSSSVRNRTTSGEICSEKLKIDGNFLFPDVSRN